MSPSPAVATEREPGHCASEAPELQLVCTGRRLSLSRTRIDFSLGRHIHSRLSYGGSERTT